MIDAHVNWFFAWMGEEHAEMVHWWESSEPAVPEAAELVAMFEKTWQAYLSGQVLLNHRQNRLRLEAHLPGRKTTRYVVSSFLMTLDSIVEVGRWHD